MAQSKPRITVIIIASLLLIAGVLGFWHLTVGGRREPEPPSRSKLVIGEFLEVVSAWEK